jgi:hypothetical protein
MNVVRTFRSAVTGRPEGLHDMTLGPCGLNLRTRDQDRGPKSYIAAAGDGGSLAKLRLASSLLA